MVLVGTAHVFAQGSTTSAMNGKVLDQNGEPLPGATVIAIHQPSGSEYGSVTNLDGLYRIPNMRIGGPYKVIISFVGYSDKVNEGLYLRLGESFRLNADLDESATELEALIVTASANQIGGDVSGAATSISKENIESMPTLNRDLNDFTRLTPQAKQSFGGGFSIANTNNRYNAIYFDGAVNNDVFGLAANGTNGGQTGAPPISIDAIEQIQVVISPYDVSYGGFAGGGINAVTKSGSNNLEGGVYFFNQNESLVGKTNSVLADRADGDRERVDEFSTNFTGINLGGPIIKDKLFFFVNAELQRETTPIPFEEGDYVGNSSIDSIRVLQDYLQSQYDYDAGDFGDKEDELEASRLFLKLDWNISKNHKLMFRHNYNNILQTNRNGSGRSAINFANNGVSFPSITNSTVLELNSMFGTEYSNKLIVGYTNVRDDRDPIGQNFPAVVIGDGNGAEIEFGSEPFSTANQLDQDVFTITNNFNIYRGKHTITLGTHNEFISFYNLFIRQNFGFYDYDSPADFYNNDAPGFYTRSYSLVDDITGDGSAAAAEFNAMQLGFYVQDEFQVNDKLTLTAGIRLDVPIITSDPEVANDFNSVTLTRIDSAGYFDVDGVEGGSSPSGQLMWSPRLGFNYDLNGDKTTVVRGGLGLFTSRVPFVWPGGMFTNNGIAIGGFNNFDVSFPIQFIGDVDNQYTNPELSTPQGQVDLFVEDFKFPQIFRTNLAVDKVFGDGWLATVEGIFTKTINNINYKSINSSEELDFNWTNGSSNTDNRPVFVGESIDSRYSAIYLASNTNEGYTYTFTGQVQKRFDFGLSASAAYTYGDGFSLFEGTSSQNSSQWRGAFTTDGRNNPELARTDFSIGHRIILSLNHIQDWTGNGRYNTSVSLFYNGESGQPFSYVYGRGSGDSRNINGERGSTSRTRSLIYVPENQNDIVLVATDDESAAQQWEALDTFIEEDEYLSTRRGQYAERNAARAPFINQLDFRLAQDVAFQTGNKEQRLQFSLDIFNFANLLNSEWGVIYSNPFDYNILNFEGYDADGTTPTFTFTEPDLGDDRFGIANLNSRWRMRFGVRYSFN